MKNLKETLIWLLKRGGYLKKEFKNLYQYLLYQPQSRFLLRTWDAPLSPLNVIKFYGFWGRVGFASREFIALISDGKLCQKSILLDGFDKIDMAKLYREGSDDIPWPKPPLVELSKRVVDDKIFDTIERSYALANEHDPDKFDRATWWEEMTKAFKEELFDNGKINQEYLRNFRGMKELPANIVKDQFLVVNREFGYHISYLKAIDLVLEYHRLGAIVSKEILFSVSESYAGNNLCVNYRGLRLSLRSLFYTIIVDNIVNHTEFESSRPVIFEIGAGYGGLSRILKTYIPDSCHILLDLPETLTYASYFIAYNYPDKKVAYLSDIIDRLDHFDEILREYDFVLIPPWVSRYIPDNSIDMVIDTSSLAEMSKVYTEYYLGHIDRTLKYKGYFYSMNKRHKREEDKVAFYEWHFKSQFTTVLYEYSKLIHPQWLGRKIG
jgi:putative sugar O-methyltransferase